MFVASSPHSCVFVCAVTYHLVYTECDEYIQRMVDGEHINFIHMDNPCDFRIISYISSFSVCSLLDLLLWIIYMELRPFVMLQSS